MVAHGDTGCYTMLMFAPTEQLMHNYSAAWDWAGEPAAASTAFITNKQIVFMGDGTFFHSGQIAISNAIKNGQDITYIILENGTTAMTGHQEHAGTEARRAGQSLLAPGHRNDRPRHGRAPARSPWRSCRPPIARVQAHVGRNDSRRRRERCSSPTRNAASPIIANVLREEAQDVKKHGYLPKKTHMNVTPEVCENCLECTKADRLPRPDEHRDRLRQKDRH